MSNGLINRQYVGARYVPKIMGEWNKALQYEALSVVTYMGNSFTSKVPVPANSVDINNEYYWINSGNYNAQVEEYRKETETKITYFNTVKEMKESTKIKNGQVVTTLGYYNINDGGGATYKITNNAPNGFYETLNNGLYAILIHDTILNVLQLGVKQNIDQTDVINNILLKTKNLYFPTGTYIFNITFNTACIIIGDGIDRTIFKPNTTESVIKLHLNKTTYHAKFKDFSVYGNDVSPFIGKGIELENATLTLSEFTNIGIGHFEYAFYSNNSNYSNEYNNVHFSDCMYGFYHPLNDYTVNNNQFNFCHFNGNKIKAVELGTPNNAGISNYFYGCDFEGNTIKGRSTISLNGLNNTEFNSCYFERNGRNNNNFEQTIDIYNPNFQGEHKDYQMNVTFINCNFTQERNCINTNYNTNITLIECIENATEGNSFIRIDRTSYVNYIGGSYNHVNKRTVIGNMYELYTEPNIKNTIKTQTGVIYIITAYSAGENQMLELFITPTGTLNMLYKSNATTGINIEATYTNNQLNITNKGTNGVSIAYKII